MAANACPHCDFGSIQEGTNFCPRCGGTLRGVPCPKCNAATEAGDQFCNQCGGAVPTGTGAGRLQGLAGNTLAAWAVAGLLLITTVVLIATRGSGGREITLAPPAAQTQGAAPDLSSMTPREAADRLFGRVMGSVEAGDQAQADQFLPMAIGAYARIDPLNLDDRFHLSLLHAVGGDGATALTVAQEGLAVRSTHLLLLAAAAEAAIVLEDAALAEANYELLVDSFDTEIAAGLPEYAPEAHSGDLLNTLRNEANAYLSGVSR